MKKTVIKSLFFLGFATLILFPKVAYAEPTTDEENEITEETLPEFQIRYDLDGGFFPEDTEVKETFTSEEETFFLPIPQKAGYLFDGWYTTKSFYKSTDVIEKGTTATYIPQDGSTPYIAAYAKWNEVETSVPEIESLTNPCTGVIFINLDLTGKRCEGYEIQYADDPEFTEKVHTKDNITSIYNSISHKLGLKTYYFRARGYETDSTGERVYSDYSYTKHIYLFNGATEIEPNENCGTIDSLRISGSTVTATGLIPERVAGDDDNYYVVKYDPLYDSVIGAVSSFEKDDEFSASFGIGGNLMSKFAIAVKEGNSYTRITPFSFIDNPEALAGYTEPHPSPGSKKGRQGTYDTSAGDKHYFHNFYLDDIIATAGSHDVAYSYNGKTYYFYNPTHHIDYNKDIAIANKNGGTVTMQIMLRYSGNSTDLITPSGRTPGYNYYAMNVEEAGSREKLEAAFMFIADYWSKPGRHVDNWILGNEVNTFLNTTGRWYWAGRISRDSFMTNYSNTFRILYYAVKSHNANGQVFICTDHTWNDRDNDWGTKGFITTFDSYIHAMSPHIQWNLANHAYTAVLTNADPWNDGAVRIYSVAHSTGASFVSPYNLEVLSNYVANNFPNTRIILSEVGFSSTGGTNPTLNGGRQAGADVQAAATAYLFYKAQFTSNIDACIFHTGDEGEPGKNFNIEGKPAWDVYVFMDTPSYAAHTEGYLGLIGGASSWSSIIPGFNDSVLQSLPNR